MFRLRNTAFAAVLFFLELLSSIGSFLKGQRRLASLASLLFLLSWMSTPTQAHERCRRQPVRKAAAWVQEHRPLRTLLTAPVRRARERRCQSHHTEHHSTHHVEHHAAASKPAGCTCEPCTCPPGECRCPDRVAMADAGRPVAAYFNVKDDTATAPLTAEDKRCSLGTKHRHLVRRAVRQAIADADLRQYSLAQRLMIRAALWNPERVDQLADMALARVDDDTVSKVLAGDGTPIKDAIAELIKAFAASLPQLIEALLKLLVNPVAAATQPIDLSLPLMAIAGHSA